jgi:hypothetical protein
VYDTLFKETFVAHKSESDALACARIYFRLSEILKKLESSHDITTVMFLRSIQWNEKTKCYDKIYSWSEHD